MGKTFTIDPISKCRLNNFGEEDQFYIHEHHEPIISREVFDKAQQILGRRSLRRSKYNGKSRKYAFSCLLECGFCGSNLSRRSWHSSSEYNKMIWQCVTATKKGKKFCEHSKGIAEKMIEDAFMESYRLLCGTNNDVLDEFMRHMEEALGVDNFSKQLKKVRKAIATIEQKRSKLVDMRLEDIIDKDEYEVKYSELGEKLIQLTAKLEDLQESAVNEESIKKRLTEFKRTLEKNELLPEFDRYVFESIIEKVIIGGHDKDGNIDPHKITFIYKTDFTNDVDGAKFKPKRKNAKIDKLCSDGRTEVDPSCSHHNENTCGMVLDV